MSTSNAWTIKEHVIPAAFPREHLRATLNPDTRLKLALKQYTPINQTPVPGDITIIVTHGNGFHKELYEPFFDELLDLTRNSIGFRIRSIWALDAANEGASGVLNEKDLGEDPCWNDYCRDVEQMVNHFSALMPAPRFGIGHSMGGQCIFECALRNPGLFTAIIGIDPIILSKEEDVFDIRLHPIFASVRRRDIWPSLEEAESFFRSRPFYKTWDSRVLDAQIKYGLRSLPTHIYPTPPHPPNGVTLATNKHQEVFQFLRPHTSNPNLLGRPEPHRTFRNLPDIKIPILYVYGGKSQATKHAMTAEKKKQNPHAEEVTVEEAGHTIPQEMPRECALAIVGFLGKHAKRWEKEREKEGERMISQVIYPDFLKRMSKM